VSRYADQASRKRTGLVFLVLGYFCVLGLLLNIVARLGWFHLHIPGLDGFGSRWKWGLGAALCFAFAWYTDRASSRRPEEPR